MAQVKLKGNPVKTSGELPALGCEAPDFTLTGTDLADVSLAQFRGKRVVLNMFMSVDTGPCAASVRRFNEELAGRNNTVVLCISRDLPFAHARFCEAEGIKGVIPLSEMRGRSFGEDYGNELKNGPLAGLLARSVVILDEEGKVAYTQQVEEISEEPDYEKALAVLSAADSEPLPVCTASFSAEDSRGDGSDEPCDDGRAG